MTRCLRDSRKVIAHLWILLRIFVQHNPVREEETFDLSPKCNNNNNKISPMSVCLGLKKKYDLFRVKCYTTQCSFGHGFPWHHVHAILKFTKEIYTMGLTFRCLTLSQNFKNARIRKLHRVCILTPINFPDKGAASHSKSSSSNNEFSLQEVLLSITPKFFLLRMYAGWVLSHFNRV